MALFAATLVDLNASITAIWFLGFWAIFAVIAFYAREIFVKILFAAAARYPCQGAELAFNDGSHREVENEAQNLQDPTEIARTARRSFTWCSTHLGLDGMALGPEVYQDCGPNNSTLPSTSFRSTRAPTVRMRRP